MKDTFDKQTNNPEHYKRETIVIIIIKSTHHKSTCYLKTEQNKL